MIRLLALLLIGTIAMVATPASAACKTRVPTSLASSSERAGPTVPCIASEAAKQQSASRPRAPKPFDPMKQIRNRMLAGEDVGYTQLQRLADSGDDLGAYYLAKRIEADADPETLDTAGHYYLRALYADRNAALKPVIRLLITGAYNGSPSNLRDAEKILVRLATAGDGVARDGLIAMYRAGTPFGAQPDRADELLAASAKAGDGKAALDLAVALMSGPEPGRLDEARDYLEIAALSDTLNIRTMAENLLRNLDPMLTANTETVQ